MLINGKEIAVEIDGADGAPAVLFVHGLGATSNFFQLQADALSDRFQVIRPDLEGAGRSPVHGPISISSHAEDLAALLDALGVPSAAVVAHSMGTLVARDLAQRFPGKVSSLALLGAVREPTGAVRQAQRDRASVLREKGTAAVAPGVVANALSDTTRRDKPIVAAFVRELVMRQDAEGYARNCEALAAANDPGPVDPALPLLLVTGSEDKVGPPDASADLAEAHGSATVEIVPGTGHWTALEAAAETTAQLLKFI
jgi:pimeloyl-ACP methyl ester carboxylesterase